MEVYGCLEETSIVQHNNIQYFRTEIWKMEVFFINSTCTDKALFLKL